MSNNEIIKSKIRSIPDFPKKGIIFRDITTLLQDKEGLKLVIDELTNRYSKMDIDTIAGIEARGFIIGWALAYQLGLGFVPVRKKGKLPFKCVDLTYKKEYECDTIEVHEDAIEKGQKVLLIDDLLATGGTIKANISLVEKLGGKVVGIGFLIELCYLDGRKAIGDKYEMFSIIRYDNTEG